MVARSPRAFCILPATPRSLSYLYLKTCHQNTITLENVISESAAHQKTATHISTMFTDLLCPVCWHDIEFLLQLIQVPYMLPLREFSIHERRCSRSESIVPCPNQEHVQKQSGKKKLWVPNKNEE